MLKFPMYLHYKVYFAFFKFNLRKKFYYMRTFNAINQLKMLMELIISILLMKDVLIIQIKCIFFVFLIKNIDGEFVTQLSLNM